MFFGLPRVVNIEINPCRCMLPPMFCYTPFPMFTTNIFAPLCFGAGFAIGNQLANKCFNKIA